MWVQVTMLLMGHSGLAPMRRKKRKKKKSGVESAAM